MNAARAQALRLRVFRYVLAFHKQHRRWPGRDETIARFDTSDAGGHWLALRGADGLPPFRNRRGKAHAPSRGAGGNVVAVDHALRDMGRRFNPDTYVDVRGWE